MNIEIKNTGARFTSFMESTAKVSIDELSNTFSFKSGVAKKINLDFGIGDECVVYVDEQRIITGHIEIISGRGSGDDNSIDIIGRDKTGDIVDSSIGSLDDIRPPITLKAAIERVIAHIGSEVDVVNMVKPKLVFEKPLDLLTPEAGDNAFEFIEKLARNKKAILSSNDEGNVVIQRNIGTDIDAHLVNKINGSANNVISYEFDYDHTGRFNKYISVGNSNLNLIDQILNIIASEKVIDVQGFSLDKLSREGRQFVIASENPGPSPQQKERTEWERNIRRARSRVYTAKVSGFTNQAGDIWTPNTIIKVVDDNARINDRLLINAVTYRLDPQQGRTTEISCVNRDTYKLESEEPQEVNAVSAFDEVILSLDLIGR